MASILEEFVKSIPTVLEGKTHCWKFNMEMLKMSSPHFEKVDSHYEDGGLMCTYKCNIDEKLYTIKVTPQK